MLLESHIFHVNYGKYVGKIFHVHNEKYVGKYFIGYSVKYQYQNTFTHGKHRTLGYFN